MTSRAPGHVSRLRAAAGRARERGLRRMAVAGLGFLRAIVTYPLAWIAPPRRDALSRAVADLLILGFHGATSRSPSARLLARQARRGEVGAIFFVTQNVGTLADVKGLLALFRTGGATALLAIDHEGGSVQRLTEAHGFTRLPAAHRLAAKLSPEEATSLYRRAGQEFAGLGFDIALGPVLDLHDPENTAIGKLRRAYSKHPEQIAAYGLAFCRGFASAGLLCAAKHFPGHGRSSHDSHRGLADISASWDEQDLAPFRAVLTAPGAPAIVMTGHLRLTGIAPDGRPATVSAPIVTGLLRDELGYQGVVMTDDIDMDAVSHAMDRRAAFIQALAAGNDLIMIKNLFGYDPLLPRRAVGWVRSAISQGTLTEAQVFAAAGRVRALRGRRGGQGLRINGSEGLRDG